MPAHPSLALLAARIEKELGLAFGPNRTDELERGLAGAARDFGIADEGACVHWLLSVPWTQAQVRTLAEHLTVGETYFFRDPPLLDAFAGHMLPAVLRRRRAEGRRCLRVWSAGCCTGEEPYSLAILIAQVLPDLAEWDVSILATDVNPRFLEKARAARYGEWSFRQATAGLKQLYFERADDGRLQVNAAIRSLVDFAELNMVRDIHPCAVNGTGAFDVVFCRNVLMYFSAQQARQAARRLQQSVCEGGWLVVSPSEASSTAFPELEPVNFESAVAFRRQAAAAVPVAPVVQAAVSPVEPVQPIRTLAGTGAAVESLASARRTACALADRGLLAQALVACDRWVSADKLDPRAHYLRGAVLAELGDASGARRALQRCLYLQPDFVLAHLVLGGLTAGRVHENVGLAALEGRA